MILKRWHIRILYISVECGTYFWIYCISFKPDVFVFVIIICMLKTIWSSACHQAMRMVSTHAIFLHFNDTQEMTHSYPIYSSVECGTYFWTYCISFEPSLFILVIIICMIKPFDCLPAIATWEWCVHMWFCSISIILYR